MTRKLTLRTEHLAELSPADLGTVVGGAKTSDCPDYTYYCITGYALCGRFSLTHC